MFFVSSVFVAIIQVYVTEYSRIVLTDPVSMNLDQYNVVSLTDALRGFLQDLPTPIIPPTVYTDLINASKGRKHSST